jgi:hypothetical protein
MQRDVDEITPHLGHAQTGIATSPSDKKEYDSVSVVLVSISELDTDTIGCSTHLEMRRTSMCPRSTQRQRLPMQRSERHWSSV